MKRPATPRVRHAGSSWGGHIVAVIARMTNKTTGPTSPGLVAAGSLEYVTDSLRRRIRRGLTAAERAPSVRSRPTMPEVATFARVSIKTVSRVINAEPDVSARLRTRVQAAVEHLD